MSRIVISIENLSKYYKLGVIGGGMFRDDVARWIAKVKGRPDPTLRVGTDGKVHRKRGDIWALRDINLDVTEGEILGVIGRNGAGKSTLLKILSRITAPTEGRAVIRGRVGSLLEVGTGFHHELTGRENIYLNGAILGMSKAEVDRKLSDIVEFAEMEKFVDTPVKRYSSGMTVRLAFAVAAHLEPEILIVDEVLAVGDIAFQKKCLGKMQDVATQGRTVLFVSHNMSSIRLLCTQAVLLQSGELAASGEVNEIVDRYMEQSPTQSATWKLEDRSSILENEAWITSAAVVSIADDATAVIVNGRPLKVVVHFVVGKGKTIRELGVFVSIKDKFGNELFVVETSTISGFPLKNISGSGTAELIIERLPLIEGAYKADLALSRPGHAYIHRINDAIAFYVNDANLYGGPGQMSRERGYFLVPHAWRYTDGSGNQSESGLIGGKLLSQAG